MRICSPVLPVDETEAIAPSVIVELTDAQPAPPPPPATPAVRHALPSLAILAAGFYQSGVLDLLPLATGIGNGHGA